MTPQVQPLSYQHRNLFFYFLAAAFFLSLPFLFLYATGYRFSFTETSIVSTGGLYVAAERSGAQIFIDDELVRETRVFRRAFYSQGLPAGTHRVHVQKDDHHTWVKELPVYPHLVTEAQAFNLPLVPTVRVVAPWQTAGGVAMLTASSSVLALAEPANQYLFEPRAATSSLVRNPEFASLVQLFTPTAPAAAAAGAIDRARSALTNTSPDPVGRATTTKEWRGVRLYEEDGEVYAAFIGPHSQMPYYYCAEEFPPYDPFSTSTRAVRQAAAASLSASAAAAELEEVLPLDVQTVAADAACDPVIRIDRSDEEVIYFDFFPNSTDLVVLAQPSGVYVVEIDDRSWQNRQPLLPGTGLKAAVQGGAVYAYDGEYVYQVIVAQNWF